MGMQTMPISDNLKALRDQKRLTQGELSKLANIELAQISRIERGASQPKLETIKKLALALECSADDLIFDDGEKSLSRRTKEAFEEVEKLSPAKKNEILNVVQSYCFTELFNAYAREDNLRRHPDEAEFIDEQFGMSEIERRNIALETRREALIQEEKELKKYEEHFKAQQG